MAEGLSAGDVASEISRHQTHSAEHEEVGEETVAGDGKRRHDQILSVVEAVMLAIVAVLAAYTGFAAAKWSTEAADRLAGASAARTEAARADTDAMNARNFDSTTFNTWFTAYVAGNTTAEAVAERRFRPAFRVAFEAWLATHPFTNPQAPPEPTNMPQYKQPELALSNSLDKKANNEYALGVQAGSNSDNYVRDTIYLATILFLVGISGHFRFFWIRVGLVVLGGSMMIVALVAILTAPAVP